MRKPTIATPSNPGNLEHLEVFSRHEHALGVRFREDRARLF